MTVCNVVSLLLEHRGAETFLGTLEHTVPWPFPCWFWMTCACPRGLDCSPSTTANAVDAGLVWLQVKSSAQSDAGEMNVHQADLTPLSPTAVFVRTVVSAPQLPPFPAALVMLTLIRGSCSSSQDPSLCSPCSPLLPAGCWQAGFWHPLGGGS